MKKKNNKKGFTLAELLIVVAIIAVLTAIAIPIFSTQLEKSKEATDKANVRSAYAEVVTQYLTDNSSHTMKVTAMQGKASWENSENGELVVMKGSKEALLKYNAKTNGDQYEVTIDKSGNVTVDGVGVS